MTVTLPLQLLTPSATLVITRLLHGRKLNWNSTYGANDFFDFCGNVTDPDPSKQIRQVDFAFANYTKGAALGWARRIR